MRSRSPRSGPDTSSEMNKEFLLAVFHEVNDHMRNTEQKYLIVTASYLGLLSVITSSITSSTTGSRSGIVSHFLLLLIGTAVYIMQGWYRAWKRHYLSVCLNIRQRFAVTMDEGLCPYWLRPTVKVRRRTIDNLLKGLTLLVNLGLACLIASELREGITGLSGTAVAILFVLLYGLFLFALDRMMRISNYLTA